MKKLMILLVAVVLAMSATMSTSAAKKEPIFEKDPSVRKEGKISVYDQDIREKVNGNWSKCSCYGLHICTEMYHILEGKDKTDNFYSTFFNGDYMFFPAGQVYEKTFSYEKSIILRNLFPFFKGKKIENVFRNNEWGLYDSFQKLDRVKYLVTSREQTPIIITDLWNRKKDLYDYYDREIVFCVPYASTNKEGVLHCEDVVNDILWEHNWWRGWTDVYVAFTDEVIVKYSNEIYNGDFGYVRIYVP